MKRRTLLRAGIVLSVAEIAGVGWNSVTVMPLSSRFRPHLVVSDMRFPESVALGRTSHRLGIREVATHGDPTTLWTDELRPLWRKYSAVVMGITTVDALFCLELLAADYRMEVIERGTLEQVAAVHPDLSTLLADAADLVDPTERSAPVAWIIAPRPMRSMGAV